MYEPQMIPNKQPPIMWMWHLLLLTLLHTTHHVTAQIELPQKIDNMATDKVTGDIFVTASDSLYRFSKSLEQSEHLSISLCRDFYHGCDDDKSDDTLNELLMVDEDQDNLILCNAEGICLRFSLDNLDIMHGELLSMQPHVPQIRSASLVSAKSSRSNPARGLILDIAANRLVLGNKDRQRKHTLSKCILTYVQVSLAPFPNSPAVTNTTYQCAEEMELIHAFSHDDQDVTIGLHNDETVMTISRKNRGSSAYTVKESVLKCSSGGMMHGIMKTAHVAEIGQALAQDLGMWGTNMVLFGIFQNLHGGSSVLCMYPFSQFDTFLSNSRFHESESFSDQDLVRYTIMTFPYLEAESAVDLEEQVTSISISKVHVSTVAYLGTANGHVKSFVIESASQLREYHDDIISGEGNPIGPPILLDHSQTSLYVTSDNQLHQQALYGCHAYKTYDDCHTRQNPYCGWCYRDVKCSISARCNKGRLGWKPYSEKKVKIVGVSPSESDSRSLVVQVQNIPVGSFYKCSFTYEGKTVKTTAFLTHSDRRSNVSRIQCRMKPVMPLSKDIHEETLSLYLDGTDLRIKALRLINGRLEKSPVIEYTPAIGFMKGSVVSISGVRFDQVSSAMFTFHLRDKKYDIDCYVIDVNRIDCRLPSIQDYFDAKGITPDFPFTLDYKFVMEWDKQEWGGQSKSKSAQIKLYPEPKLENFTKTSGNYILLRGKHLNSVFSSKDYTISLGSRSCKVLLLLETFLRCQLDNSDTDIHDSHGSSADKANNDDASSVIKITAGEFSWSLGEPGVFAMAEVDDKDDKINVFLVFVIALGVIVVLCVSVGFVYLYVQKKGSVHKFSKEDKHKQFLNELYAQPLHHNETPQDGKAEYILVANDNDNEYLKLGYYDGVHSNRNSTQEEALLDIKLQYLDAYRPLDESVDPQSTEAPLAGMEEFSDDDF